MTCQHPGGAFYVWPNVTEACRMIGARDSEELRKRLLNEAGVAVLADIHFGPRVPNEGQHIRFSYATSPDGDSAQASSASRRSSRKSPMNSGRESILGRVRAALGKTGSDRKARRAMPRRTSPRTRRDRGLAFNRTSSHVFCNAPATWRALSRCSPTGGDPRRDGALHRRAALPALLAAQKSEQRRAAGQNSATSTGPARA